jgi:hypothetical protein
LVFGFWVSFKKVSKLIKLSWQVISLERNLDVKGRLGAGAALQPSYLQAEMIMAKQRVGAAVEEGHG